MARRSIWKGAITFGMVAIPSKLYSANEDTDISLHQYHEDCGCPLVFNGVVKLTPTQCFCSARMHQLVFEHVTGRPVQVEILESPGQGGQKCAFRLQVQE